jgi:hypothetical protein
MNRAIKTIKELINPAWGHHRTVPPLDAGLRPNDRLDSATALLPSDKYAPDDVLVTETGTIVFSSGDTLFELHQGQVTPVVTFGGRVGCLASSGERVIAAVDGVGLVSVASSGAIEEICPDPTVSVCVTDLTVLPGGALLATVGSRRHGGEEWSHALVRGDRSGLLVRVEGGTASIEADGLAWPSGIETASDSQIILSIGHDHRIELRNTASLSQTARTISGNLPVYPGRLSSADDGWWVAAPYVRNRVVEMLLDEPEVLDEMATTLSPDEWFAPRLRTGNPYTDTMQMGQLRVEGVIKPWAPVRTCGIFFRIDRTGRIAESAHAAVDSDRHGVTAVVARDRNILAAVQGYGNLLALQSAGQVR